MKPKKPNFDPSSLPSGKGISAKPAKMRDASPNFVNENKTEKVKTESGRVIGRRNVEDPGTNPGGSPVIKYQEDGPNRASIRILKPSGKFEYDKQGRACGYPSCDMPVKNEQLNTIMDKNNKNLKIGNAKKVEKYIK
jgi:hypothetical protein